MRIAVTYENGQVFQHFGHTEQFKVYEVEDGKIMKAEVVGSDGQGHEALAGLLSGKGIDVLICGGIGGGAQAALQQQGIELCAGQSGNTDDVVEAYLAGELVNSGVNCNHHEEEHNCGSHEEGGHCGHHEEGGCGHCGGGCHSMQPTMEGKNVGKNVKVHYRGTLDDGSQFDSSYDRGETLDFVCGVGQMIRGFDLAVKDMEVGQEVDVHILPEDAYGLKDPEAIFTVPIAQMPGSEELVVGDHCYLTNMYGQPFPVSVVAKTLDEITFDANHELAGQALNFHIALVAVEE